MTKKRGHHATGRPRLTDNARVTGVRMDSALEHALGSLAERWGCTESEATRRCIAAAADGEFGRRFLPETLVVDSGERWAVETLTAEEVVVGAQRLADAARVRRSLGYRPVVMIRRRLPCTKDNYPKLLEIGRRRVLARHPKRGLMVRWLEADGLGAWWLASGRDGIRYEGCFEEGVTIEGVEAQVAG